MHLYHIPGSCCSLHDRCTFCHQVKEVKIKIRQSTRKTFDSGFVVLSLSFEVGVKSPFLVSTLCTYSVTMKNIVDQV